MRDEARAVGGNHGAGGVPRPSGRRHAGAQVRALIAQYAKDRPLAPMPHLLTQALEEAARRQRKGGILVEEAGSRTVNAIETVPDLRQVGSGTG